MATSEEVVVITIVIILVIMVIIVKVINVYLLHPFVNNLMVLMS